MVTHNLSITCLGSIPSGFFTRDFFWMNIVTNNCFLLDEKSLAAIIIHFTYRVYVTSNERPTRCLLLKLEVHPQLFKFETKKLPSYGLKFRINSYHMCNVSQKNVWLSQYYRKKKFGYMIRGPVIDLIGLYIVWNISLVNENEKLTK